MAGALAVGGLFIASATSALASANTSRGIEISTGPASVSTVFARPLRELPLSRRPGRAWKAEVVVHLAFQCALDHQLGELAQ